MATDAELYAAYGNVWRTVREQQDATRYQAQVRFNAPERWETVGAFEGMPAAVRTAYRVNSADPAADGARVLDSVTGEWNYVV